MEVRELDSLRLAWSIYFVQQESRLNGRMSKSSLVIIFRSSGEASSENHKTPCHFCLPGGEVEVGVRDSMASDEMSMLVAVVVARKGSCATAYNSKRIQKN
jgi:hypothetical protein